MNLDRQLLEALVRRFDPRQTLLYLPNWRAAGYDRDYPQYDKPVPELEPFLRRAHELGFRTMLHVNYFGVDPLNPLYKEFEPYQVRDPFGGTRSSGGSGRTQNRSSNSPISTRRQRSGGIIS